MLLGFADRIFVINLPERADRRREVRAQFTGAGWDPDDPEISYFDAVKPDSLGEFPSIGAHGCFMSHLGILQQASDHGLNAIAIFEDDLDFAGDFAERLGDVEAALANTDWKIFYGGYEAPTPPPAKGPVTPAGPEVTLRTTHFICLRGEAIPLARDYLTAMAGRPAGSAEGGPMHVDGAYQWFRRAYPQFECYMATPPLGVQRSSKSDIAPLRWFDKTPLIKDAVGALRKLKR